MVTSEPEDSGAEAAAKTEAGAFRSQGRKKEAAAISPGKANAQQNFYREGNKYADDERAGI